MPPKKQAKQTVIVDSDDSDDSQHVAPTTTTTRAASAPAPVRASNVKSLSTVKFSANDSDRLQLAQAINNFTIKGEQFVSAFDVLSNFGKERLTELDLNIESKKREFNDLTEQLENDFKNNQIKTNQRLNEFRLKACEDIANEYSMMLVSKDAWKTQQETIQKLSREMEDLTKNWTVKLEDALSKERQSNEQKTQQRISQLELTHKAHSAELSAEVNQQKKEIVVLSNTIATLKEEIAQQRQLTKEVAMAGAKAQITQTIGKN